MEACVNAVENESLEKEKLEKGRYLQNGNCRGK